MRMIVMLVSEHPVLSMLVMLLALCALAPIILGGGRSSLDLAPITRCEEALRPHTFTPVLGNEVLFDCDLSAQRRPVGVARKSM